MLLGAVAQSSLILSGLVVYGIRVPARVVGVLAGLGGSLVSAIAFDPIPEGKALTTPISRCDCSSERTCSW
jgi:hypothetical protein